MKLVPTLLATALVAGSASFAMAQSGANPTPSGAAPDKSISAATHCLDKATGQPRLKSQTTGGGSVAAGNPTAGDKTAKSTGTSSQTPQSPGKGMAANLPNC
jgi:hypothetical protein